MKLISAFSLCLVLFLQSTNAGAVSIELAKGIRQIDSEIASHLRKVAASNGVDRRGAVFVSAVIRGDIDGNGTQDAFVSYSIEGIGGGNMSLLGQTLFLRVRGRLYPAVDQENGSTGTGVGSSFEPKAIVRGKIVGRVQQYAPSDGACCPSINRPASLVYKNGRLYQRMERR